MTFDVETIPFDIVLCVVNNASVDTRRALALTSKRFLSGVIASGFGTLHSHVLVDYLRTLSIDGDSTFDDVLLWQLESRLERTRYIRNFVTFFCSRLLHQYTPYSNHVLSCS